MKRGMRNMKTFKLVLKRYPERIRRCTLLLQSESRRMELIKITEKYSQSQMALHNLQEKFAEVYRQNEDHKVLIIQKLEHCNLLNDQILLYKENSALMELILEDEVDGAEELANETKDSDSCVLNDDCAVTRKNQSRGGRRKPRRRGGRRQQATLPQQPASIDNATSQFASCSASTSATLDQVTPAVISPTNIRSVVPNNIMTVDVVSSMTPCALPMGDKGSEQGNNKPTMQRTISAPPEQAAAISLRQSAPYTPTSAPNNTDLQQNHPTQPSSWCYETLTGDLCSVFA